VELLRAFDPLGGHLLYVAPSRSTPGAAYVLREAPDGRWLCGCPRFFYRGTCPHTEALYALLRPGVNQGAILRPNVTGTDRTAEAAGRSRAWRR
jgi:hypothetical protein